MSKKQLQEQLVKEQVIMNLLQANPAQAEFLKYLANKNPNATSDQLMMLAANEDNADEYFFKISYLNKVHGVDAPTAAKILNVPAVISQGMKHEIFTTVKPFMHYVVVNDTPVHIVEKYISQWTSAGLSLNMKDSTGQTPLDYALVKNRIDCVKVFSDWGVDLNKLTGGFSPLHKLVQQVHQGDSKPEVIKTWCDFGLPTGTVSAQGWTPLQFAVGLGNFGVVCAFVDCGVGSTALDNGTTVLHYCVAFDKVDVITKLKGKVDFNVKDSSHAPAITQALVQGKGAIAQALVAGGTDLTVTDINSGQTILHLLVGAKMFASAALAVQVGCDATHKDNAGISAMDLIIDAIADGSCPFQAGRNFPALEMLEVFCDKKSVPLSKENILKIEQSSIVGKSIILETMHNYVKMTEEVNDFLSDPNASVLLQIYNDMEKLKLHVGEDQIAIVEAAVKETIQGSNVEGKQEIDVSDEGPLHIAADYVATEVNTDLAGNTQDELPQ